MKFCNPVVRNRREFYGASVAEVVNVKQQFVFCFDFWLTLSKFQNLVLTTPPKKFPCTDVQTRRGVLETNTSHPLTLSYHKWSTRGRRLYNPPSDIYLLSRYMLIFPCSRIPCFIIDVQWILH